MNWAASVLVCATATTQTPKWKRRNTYVCVLLTANSLNLGEFGVRYRGQGFLFSELVPIT